MKYFYCQSYLAFNYALKYKTVCIVTSQKDIIKACEYLNIQYLKHKSFNFNEFFTKKDKVKNEVSRIVNIIKQDEFHFSHSQYAIFCFIIVNNLLENKNAPFFHNFEQKYPQAKFYISIEFFKIKCFQLLLNIIYAPIFQLRCLLKNKFVLGINEKITRKVVLNNYEYGQYNKSIEDVMMNFKINQEKLNGILFIDQGVVNEKYFNVTQSNELINYLKLNKAIIKEHPVHTQKGFFDGFKLLPSFLPVEMFFNNVSGLVISPYSNALILASKFLNIRSIALLYLIKDNSFKEKIKKKYQKESNGKITFVNSLNELQIFIKINEKTNTKLH